jgi:hypothetical protein
VGNGDGAGTGTTVGRGSGTWVGIGKGTEVGVCVGLSEIVGSKVGEDVGEQVNKEGRDSQHGVPNELPFVIKKELTFADTALNSEGISLHNKLEEAPKPVSSKVSSPSCDGREPMKEFLCKYKYLVMRVS